MISPNNPFCLILEKGVTPYRYLETIRINEAKKLLSEGVPPVEAAIRTGFSDQSHFTNYFNQFIGLAPGTYREIFSEKDGDGSVGRGYPGEYTQVRGNQPPVRGSRPYIGQMAKNLF